MVKKIIFLFATLGFSWGIAFAQLGVLPDQITVELDPKIPGPLAPVEIDLISFSTDLDRARITMYVNGALISQEIGKTTYTITSPRVGALSRVRFVIETIDSGVVERTIDLRPGQVDLMFEALDSYTPAFYPGKKLPAHEGGVRIVAIPHFIDEVGRKLDSRTLVYKWKVGNKVQLEQSGYGKSSFVFEGSPFYRTKDVTVEVESLDGSIQANRLISLPAYDPVIRFYQKHPLWGRDISQAITADKPFVLSAPEVLIEAVPYFFSNLNQDDKTLYEWRMNGQTLATFGDRNVVNLRSPDDESGQARINLKVSSNEKILQLAESLFTVIFGANSASRPASQNTSNTNFFGSSN